MSLLAATPPRIAALSAGLRPAQLQAAPKSGGWCANEVLAHLRACADVWGTCIGRIIKEEHPRIRAVHPRIWIRSTDYLEQKYASSLRAYTAQRAQLLAALRSLREQDWLRGATVTGEGKVRTRTVHFYAERLASHELRHLQQLEDIVKSRRG